MFRAPYLILSTARCCPVPSCNCLNCSRLPSLYKRSREKSVVAAPAFSTAFEAPSKDLPAQPFITFLCCSSHVVSSPYSLCPAYSNVAGTAPATFATIEANPPAPFTTPPAVATPVASVSCDAFKNRSETPLP